MKLFKKAILIVHGYAGGVYDQEYLNHQLALVDNFDVFTFTLPGHDDNISKKISYEDWIKKCDDEINFLIKNNYKNIYIVGHSMGGVLASYLASKYKEVKKLVLLAPAFRVLGFEKGVFNLDTLIHSSSEIFEQYGAKMVKSRLLKLPMNCYIELLRLINEFKDVPKNINIPTLVFWGTNDKIVPIESINHVINTIKSSEIKFIKIDGSTHDLLRENKKEIISEMIVKFFNNSNIIHNFDNNI